MINAPRSLLALNLALLGVALSVMASLARPDAERPATSLTLAWERRETPLTPTWPDQPRFTSDAARRPVFAGDVVIFTDSRHDSVTAVERDTGKTRWTFTADGPFRFAPAVFDGKVYAASDDGRLYCLDLDEGRLLWSFRGAPAERFVLGNERIISAWPARVTPAVAREGKKATVYFAAGIWPFMGVFLYALDANTGAVRWCNSGDGSTFMKQPHGADAFAGVAPQGDLVVVGDRLLVAGGRSVPACYDRHTGKRLHYLLNEGSKKGGGPDVTACSDLYANGGGCFALETGKPLGPISEPTTSENGTLYSALAGRLRAFAVADRPEPEQVKADKKSKKKKRKGPSEQWLGKPLGTIACGTVTALCVAGGTAYAGGPGQVFAVEGLAEGKPKLRWKSRITGTPAHIAAHNGDVAVSTREGRIYCFRPAGTAVSIPRTVVPLPAPTAEETSAVRRILDRAGPQAGYAVLVRPSGIGLVAELLRRTTLRLVILETDQNKAASLRSALRQADIDGKRAAVLARDIDVLPPYLCSLLLLDKPVAVEKATRPLRPFGGVAMLTSGDIVARRKGALPGSSDWTHEHANAANTRVGTDKLVKAPLGLLWFGGPGHQGILPRHGHGPSPQAVEGRLIIEGTDSLRAIDIYTGRLLWATSLPGLGKVYDNTAHQAGANAIGSNYVSLPHGIYVAHRRECLRLDPATGKVAQRYTLARLPGERSAPKWNFLTVVGDCIIGGARPAPRGKRKKGQFVGEEVSARLTVLDRRTGKALWNLSAKHGFRHNGIVAGSGKLFVLDREADPKGLARDGKRPPLQGRVMALDLATGLPAWSVEENVFGTWLSYSAEHGVLVEAGHAGRDTLRDEARGMRAYRASDGSVLWHKPTYFGPSMIHGRRVLKSGAAGVSTGDACDLLTGKAVTASDPLTGKNITWRWQRTYGCNTPAACENLVLFRSGAAGFYDLAGEGGTGNLGGFRSSCTFNLIPAGGVLTVPDYTRTCTCGYQNQTSIGLVHTPEAELWTFTTSRPVPGPVRRVGINLGAPGSRRDGGTLWLEYPRAGGPSPKLVVTSVPPKPTTFRLHSSQTGGDWITASGVRGLSKLTVNLGRGERRFTVRLFFREPDGLTAGNRVFDVSLQGKRVLQGMDIRAETREARAVVKEFKGVEAAGELVVALKAIRGEPVLCGLEIVEEQDP